MRNPLIITPEMIEAGVLAAERLVGGDLHHLVQIIYREMQTAAETGEQHRATAVPAPGPSAATPRQFHGTVDGSGCDL